jgi:hypothetical protein
MQLNIGSIDPSFGSSKLSKDKLNLKSEFTFKKEKEQKKMYNITNTITGTN